MHAWLRLIRITDFGHFLGLLLLGAFYRPSERLSALTLAVALAAGFAYLAHAYGLNNLCDVDVDRDGHLAKKNPVASGELSARAASWVVWLLAMASLILSGLLSWQHLLWMAVMIAASFLFSSRAFRLKAVPALGTLINVFIFIPLFFYGSYLTQPTWSGSLAAIGGFLSFSVVIPQLFHEIEDFQEDQREQIATLRVATSRGLLYLLIVALALSQSASGFLLFKHELLPRPAAWAAMVLAGAHITVVIIARFGYQRTGKYRLHRLVIRYLNMLFGIVLLICFL